MVVTRERKLNWGQFNKTYGAFYSKCGVIWADFGNFWPILAGFGKFRQLLANYGQLWQYLANFGQLWQLMANFGKLRCSTNQSMSLNHKHISLMKARNY
jgi:hypothetical protein